MKRQQEQAKDAKQKRRAYRKKILKLCQEVSLGNTKSASLLQTELDTNKLAHKALNFWKRRNKKRLAKPKPKLTQAQQDLKERVQRRGFEDGSHTPSSNLRKVTK